MEARGLCCSRRKAWIWKVWFWKKEGKREEREEREETKGGAVERWLLLLLRGTLLRGSEELPELPELPEPRQAAPTTQPMPSLATYLPYSPLNQARSYSPSSPLKKAYPTARQTSSCPPSVTLSAAGRLEEGAGKEEGTEEREEEEGE